jgi:CRP-like cAMP-binding protein
MDQRRTVEVAMEGSEAAVGFAAFLGGGISASQSRVRHAGSAMRMPVAALEREGELRDDRLRPLLHRYVSALLMQIAQSGVCNRFHNIDSRLAKWLLMTRDRMGSLQLHATQEYIAQLMGVRRSSITAAACGFHKQSIIDYRRGRIDILDERKLLAASCGCYALMRRQYDDFLN